MKTTLTPSLLALGCLLGTLSGLMAQDLGLHFVGPSPQRLHSNPAFFYSGSVQATLPSPALSMGNTAFSYKDLVVHEPGSDAPTLDVGGVIRGMDPDNQLRLNVRADVFSVALNLRKFQLSLGAAAQVDARLRYPRALPDLLWNGNAAHLGSSLSLAPNLQLMAYQSYEAGLAWKLSDKLAIGSRIKYLIGSLSVSTASDIATLHTEEAYYQLNLTTDYALNMSMMRLPDSTEDFELNALPFTQNKGLAVDLGVDMDVTEKLSLAMSVLNLGSINWQEDARQYRSQGMYTFSGLDVSTYFQGDSISFEQVLDTLETTFDLVETEQAYRTALPLQIYLSGRYQLLPSLQLGALFHSEFYNGQYRPALVLSGNKRVGKVLYAGLTYAMRDKRFDQIGLNLLLKAGPLFLYTATDHLLTLIHPRVARQLSFRFGLGVGI